MKCAVCQKEFIAATGPDGLPGGVGFVKEDGSIVNVCSDCITRAAYDKSVTEKVKDLMEGTEA